MSSARFNAVAIFDAIPDGELNTARRLKESLEDIAPHVAPRLHVRHIKIETLASLEEAISSLTVDAESGGLAPWIHIDGHGAEQETGFLTSRGEFCDWNYLKELVIPLNIATGLNLLVILATCFGGSFTSAITTTDRAPVLGLIGPVREIKAGEIERDFTAFYNAFLSTNSIKNALEALTARSLEKLYYCTNAEAFFYEVWHSYKQNLCTPKMIAERAGVMHRKLTDANLTVVPTIEELERTIVSQDCPQFEGFCETYFMYDIYPANRERFPVTYEKAEAPSAC